MSTAWFQIVSPWREREREREREWPFFFLSFGTSVFCRLDRENIINRERAW
jgi:hypothetical protein